MRKIYFNGYLISLTDHDWFHDREGKWHHLVIQEQTQEPESKPCHWCGAVGDEEHGCGVPEKEPECKCYHNAWEKVTRFCEVHKEKPAKKKCEHDYDSTNQCHICGHEKKDELAERLHNAYLEACNDLHPESFNQKAQVPYEKLTMEQKFLDKACADEAQKWAVEIVRKIRYEDFKDSGARWDELERRFKESK